LSFIKNFIICEKAKLEDFPTSIKIDNIEYNIEIIFSKKKSSSVSVDKKTLIFRLSSLLSKTEGQNHFSSLLKRISKKLYESIDKIQEVDFTYILERGWFEFSGEKYILQPKKIRGVKMISNTFFYDFKMNFERLEAYIVKLLIEKYSPRLDKYVREINKTTYNFKINKIELKLVKSKWGHCTGYDDLMFNLKLLNGTVEMLDYVIIHEICHIKYKDHSPRYWKEVEKHLPNYKEIRKLLKSNPPVLFK